MGNIQGVLTFNGVLDDARLYSRALSSGDVTELYGYIGDVTAPIISSIASSTTLTTATISFLTDESATSTLNYGGTTSYGTASSSNTLATSTTYILTGLSPNTLYHFQISARDNSSNLATSSDYIFTTPAIDLTPPVISSIASSTTENTATITWTTNENATSSINYGTTTSYGTASSSQTATTSHSYTVTGLLISTLYHFKVTSTDAQSNTSTSSDYTFTTTAHIADNFYIADTSAGGDTGANCANAHAESWFNNASNWGDGTSKIGGGDTVHLCGTISSDPLVFQGSGEEGSPITLLFETGASLSSEVWPVSGAIQLNNVSWIVIDGGTNGVIENTDNGPALGHQDSSRGIGGNVSGVGRLYHGIIKNLTIRGIYKKTAGMNNWDREGYPLDITGSDITIENNTLSDGDGVLGYSGIDAESANIYILNNHISDYNHGMTIGACDDNCRVSNLVIAGNSLDYSSTWDTTGDSPIHLDGIIFVNNTYSSTSRMDNVRIYDNWFGPHVGTRTTAAIFNSMQGGWRQCLNWYIYNNVFESEVGGGWGNGFLALAAENLWVFNNTFSGTLADPTHGGSAVQMGGSPIYYYNNLQNTEHGLGVSNVTEDPDFVAPPGDSAHGQENADALNQYFSDTWADYNIYTGGESAGVPYGGYLWQYLPGSGSNIVWRWDGLNGFTDGWHNWYDNNRNMPLPIWNTAHADPHSGTGTVTFNNGTYIPANNDTVALGQGVNLSSVFSEMGVPALDYDGNPRPATGPWTIGAYEVSTTTPDTTSPTLTLIASSTTSTTATITWNTNEFSTSTVRYGGSTSYGSASTSASYIISHTIVITGLTAGNAYHFQVSSSDSSGNLATSSDKIFTTAGLDTTPPVLSAGSPSTTQSSGTTGVTLSLSTDENATCKYGTTASTAYASIATTFTTTVSTTHSTSVTGLSDGNTYTYYVRCTDGSNPNTSDYTISFSVASPTNNTNTGGGGGGGGGGGTYTIIYPTASTTAATPDLGCKPGNIFSSQTGKRCTTTIQVNPALKTALLANHFPPNFRFNKNLSLGTNDMDVVNLQKFLNVLGYPITLKGFGSMDNEIRRFGVATLNALAKYQKALGISPSVGYFGSTTRGKINDLLKGLGV